MNKLKINLGRSNSVLYKSKNLIGIKLRPNAKKLPAELDPKKLVHRSLAGFAIYKVGSSLSAVNRVLDKVRKHRNVLLGTHVYFTEGSDKPIVPNGSIFISFDSKSTKKAQHKIIKDLKLDKYREVGEGQMLVNTTKKSDNPMKVCMQLKDAEIVADVIPDFDIPVDHYAVSRPASGMFPLQWHLENRGAAPGEPEGKIVKGADLSVFKAWQRLGNKGSNKIKLAIIDSGFQLDHPSYVDRVAGLFSLYTDAFGPTQTGHGTACAGLAAASESHDGIIGVAPNVELYLIDGTSYDWYSQQRVLDFCIEKEIDIISCSWGNQEFIGGRTPMHDKIWSEITTVKGRKGKGCIVLFAAGNENSEHVNVMGTLPNVVCVAASTSADGHWHMSNRGKEVSVAAPGGDWPLIAPSANFSIPQWHDGKERGPAGLYDHFEGTSASTPLVAGVCALILSANPDLTGLEVKSILERTADKIGNKNSYTNGHSIRFGHGRVNADKAVQEAIRMKDPSAHLTSMSDGTGDGLYELKLKPLPTTGWGIEMGSLSKDRNVLKAIDKLQASFGKRVMVSVSEVDGLPKYNSVLGPFNTKQEAATFQQKVSHAGIISTLRNLKNMR